MKGSQFLAASYGLRCFLRTALLPTDCAASYGLRCLLRCPKGSSAVSLASSPSDLGQNRRFCIPKSEGGEAGSYGGEQLKIESLLLASLPGVATKGEEELKGYASPFRYLPKSEGEEAFKKCPWRRS